MKFSEVFHIKKPILGMLHLKGDTPEETLERAMKELQIYEEGDVDGVIVENYFGTYDDMVLVLNEIEKRKTDLVVGANCLGCDALGFELASRYPFVKFIQIDSVVGHVKERNEANLRAFFKLYRERVNVCVFGGVRFKYQPVLSIRTVEEDLQIAQNRCDAICVTEDATGQETSMEKIIKFRNELKNFPLVVAAGTNIDNIAKQLEYCDAAIVGSTFKDTRKDTGNVSLKNVQEFMEVVKLFRKEHYDTSR
ncbi:BtpA/SgcQ family protein [uncultured Traorella sp.]|uniref:BtpA/SgcQ family protein n=1 Tax=uncultured Traorella sp. TaxID=1929048 RepID=UPI0025F75C5C|nr:BtpA/SgcQ family protein [uncultured Traorella sp.]